MPLYRRKRPALKRRPVYRRKRTIRRPRRKLKVFRPLRSGFPKTTLQRLRYSTVSTLSTTVATNVNMLVMRGNDCYAPNGLTTHQPLGFDQWTGMYGLWIVLGSKITCRFLPVTESPTTLQPFIVGVYCDRLSTPQTEARVIEQNKGRYAILPQSASRPIILSAYYSPRKLFDLKQTMDNVTNLGGSPTVSPTQLSFFNIWVSGNDPSASAGSVQVQYTVEYLVKFFAPVDIAQS